MIFSIFNKPTEEEQVTEDQRIQDSIARVQKPKPPVVQEDTQQVVPIVSEDTLVASNDSLQQIQDSIALAQKQNRFGIFAKAADGKSQDLVIENELIKAVIASKGGKLKSIELKNYKTYDSLPLMLFDDSSTFNLSFEASKAGILSTADFYFEPQGGSVHVQGNDSGAIALRLQTTDPNKYIEYVYSLAGESNMMHFHINIVGLKDVIAPQSSELYASWNIRTPDQEKTKKNQQRYTTIYYRYKNGEVDYLSEARDDDEKLEAPIHWLAFKEQFFTTAFIADNEFSPFNADVATRQASESSAYIKDLQANVSIPYDFSDRMDFGMRIYAGPNKYSKLEDYNIDLEGVVPLGWGIFGWVNKYLVIPVFNFLDGFDMGYGVIIFLLTLFIKLILLPIFYKTTLSSQRMKVLRPDIQKINEKFKDDSMKKQQATMELYRKAGVSPLAGCIPMLIQMPILIAMFRFFPASIELRQQSFLWAEDLSTYDEIYRWTADVPFFSWAFDNHISLFTIMMAISLFFYTRLNTQFSSGQMDGPMAGQMKIMTNFMPVMMLFFFNSYAAGLSYYYFLANLMSIGQTFIIRKYFVDEEAIRRKIEENKKNPKKQKKKSGFAKRLEEVAKQQQERQRKR